MLDKDATYIGRFSNGTARAIIVIPPENSAEAPAPATALPTISIGELVATAQITDPTAKPRTINELIE